jgi:hypothetical protein
LAREVKGSIGQRWLLEVAITATLLRFTTVGVTTKPPFISLSFIRVDPRDPRSFLSLLVPRPEADGEVEQGEQDAEGGTGAAQTLAGLFGCGEAMFKGVQSPRLADAEDLFHLGFQDLQVAEDLGFKVGHTVLLNWRGDG